MVAQLPQFPYQVKDYQTQAATRTDTEVTLVLWKQDFVQFWKSLEILFL